MVPSWLMRAKARGPQRFSLPAHGPGDHASPLGGETPFIVSIVRAVPQGAPITRLPTQPAKVIHPCAAHPAPVVQRIEQWFPKP